eukprot:TRINITY_DN6321_c0_g1_i1.p1 TRINITY_DN6321_c0_g1~~TRINITY_DN6321_c0_g1_i1.p1  ORF type:complete len:550 (+),score=222.39 TRINITY_DN6321_c0_g1_i1:99-1748(+)
MRSLVFLAALLVCTVQGQYFSAFYDQASGKYYYANGQSDNAVVWAFYSDDVESIGWGRLTLNTTANSYANFTDDITMHAAGYLEAVLTQERIWQSYLAFLQQFNNSVVPQSLQAWIVENIAWARAQVAANPQDQYWVQVGLVFAQYDGLVDGYNVAAPASQKLDPVTMYLLSASADAGDIISAIQTTLRRDSAEWQRLDAFRSVRSISDDFYAQHCSVIVKVTDDLSELFAAHDTWSGFGGMLRIYKIYNFQLRAPSTNAISTSFSAYPATLSSIDDFYALSSGFAVMETTNGLFNNSLYSAVVPHSLLSFVRVVVANRMATGGQQWTQLLASYNSGTYNNQWQVVDFNKFVPGQKVADDTLWIIEQIPGFTQSGDVSFLLRDQGYFPSYNIPYFKNIFNISGFPSAVAQWGSWFDYNLHPRALIYAREQSKVQNLGGAKYIQRFNEWQTDPVAKGNSINAIASRGDLVNQTNPANPFLARSCFGAIDAKITSSKLIKNFQAVAISGPTYNEQPYFRWTDEWSNVVHVGQPELFNFDWQTFSNDVSNLE